MSVAPHPHTGLQTVSWPFEGEIEHRDSAGHHALVLPGEVNLMTAGRGISHSEVSTPATRVLHGAQLWVALPETYRHAEPGFVHHAPPELNGPGWTARVFLGSLLGETSPVPTATPLLGAEIRLAPGTSLGLAVESGFEHGVLVDQGAVAVDGQGLAQNALGYLAPRARPADAHDARRRGAAAAAGRRAVRGGDRDVVELRRPQPRGDRGLPGGVADPDRRGGRHGGGLPTGVGRPLRRRARRPPAPDPGPPAAARAVAAEAVTRS